MGITVIVVALTVVISFLAFGNRVVTEELIFWPYRIWNNNEWYRVISCGFIHADIMHLAFNMIALFSFGQYVESAFIQIYHGKGLTLYIIMYFAAIALADVYNLFTRRDDYNYRSLGASGGVSAIIFSYILINPFGSIYVVLFPMPAIVFGPLYLAYCIYMARRGSDNIGHIAHFTGSVFGFVFPIIFAPELLPDFIHKLTHTL